MRDDIRQHSAILSRRTLVAGVGACALASSIGLSFPHFARADELSETIDEYQELATKIDAVNAELEQAADNYYKAQIIYDAAKEKVTSIENKIAENEAELAALRSRLARRIELEYKNDEMGLLSVLMQSTSFEDFATKWDMVALLNENDAALAEQVRLLREGNKMAKAKLSPSKRKAEARLQETEAIQRDAQEKIAELEVLFQDTSAELETLLGLDQAAALANADDVLIIGNPRNIPAHPEVIPFAESRIGCPYVWAAAGPSSFDCSGLVVWAFDKAGISGLPHYTESLYGLALAVGAVLPLKDVEPGDVLYRPGHVGIATGHGGRPYIHAPYTGALVRDTDSLAYARFVCGLRFPGAGVLSPEELQAALAAVNAEIIAAEEAEREEESENENLPSEKFTISKEQKKKKRSKKSDTRNTTSSSNSSSASSKAESANTADEYNNISSSAVDTSSSLQDSAAQAEAEEAARAQAEAEEALRREMEEAARLAEEEAARREAEEAALRELEGEEIGESSSSIISEVFLTD